MVQSEKKGSAQGSGWTVGHVISVRCNESQQSFAPLFVCFSGFWFGEIGLLLFYGHNGRMEDANQGESSKVLEFPEDGVIVINGVTYSSKGYEVCGVRNQHQKPCMRIGRCPFHPKPERDAAASSGTGGKVADTNCSSSSSC
jgi:hypothetical protein